MVLALQTIAGNVVQVYELRTVGKDNIAVVDASIAVTPRKKVNGEWEDGETYWPRVKFWGTLAENVAECWKPGDRIFVYGRTEMNPPYEKDGKEYPARPVVVAQIAGHDDSYYPSVQQRKNSGNNSKSSATSSSSGTAKSTKPAAKPAKDSSDSLDLDFSEFAEGAEEDNLFF